MSRKGKVEENEREPQDSPIFENFKSDHKDAAAKSDKDEATQEEQISVETQLRDDLAKEKDKNLRLFAEFENYKKRTSKERMELFKTAGQEVLVALLPVLDDFDRALKELSKSEDSELFTGVTLIHNKFKETLKNKGLEEIEVAAGDRFDAERHEAITQVPSPDETMKGKIIDVVEKGFKLGKNIVRYPKVVVGN